MKKTDLSGSSVTGTLLLFALPMIAGNFFVFLYHFYAFVLRALGNSVVPLVSLGTRVALAYLLAPIGVVGVYGIWAAIPIGWVLADGIGLFTMKKQERRWEEIGACGER